MSDYEMINRKTAARRAAYQRDSLRRTVYLLSVVLAVVLVFTGLWAIDFISDAFALILIGCTSLWGAFKAGQFWKWAR